MGAARSFALKFSDPDFIDILKVVRPQTCSRGCCGICCQSPIMHVELPPGNRVAYITEKYVFIHYDYSLKYEAFSPTVRSKYVNSGTDTIKATSSPKYHLGKTDKQKQTAA